MKRASNQLKIGALLSYAQMFLNIIIGLLYTPIMIRLLGQSEYGLYNTVASTISMLTILTLGFNSSYVRYYSKYKKDNDNQNIYKLNGLFIIIFSIIGVIALISGLFLSLNLHFIFDEGLSDSEYEIAQILMILLTINLATSFPMSVFSSIISSNERFVFLKLLGMVKTVLSPLVALPLLLMGYRSIAMVSVTLAVNIITDTLYLLYVVFVLKNKFIFHGFEKGLFKSLFSYTFFLALNLIVDQINWNIDKFLLGRYQGTISVAIYSVGVSIYQYYMMFSCAISGVFTPRIHKIVNDTVNNLKARKDELTSLFVKVGRIQFLVLSLLASGLFFFGKPFISFWAGEGYEDSYYVMLLFILPATIALIQNCGLEIQRAENKHQFRSIVYIFMALINLISTIFLCQKFGAIGASIGTAISLVVANGIIMNIYYHKACDVNIIAFWKNILRMSVGLIVPVALGVFIVTFVDLYSIFHFLGSIILYALVFAISMWLFGINAYEKNLVLKPIKKLFKYARN